MAVEIKNTSRLNFSDLLVIDGIEFWDIMDLPRYRPRSDDIQHSVTDGDRIDLLSQFYYQDPSLGWLILWANDLEIAPLDLKVGMTLIIPSPQYVRSRLTSGDLR